MIKLFISVIFIFVGSCESVSKNSIINKIENSKKIVENKIKKEKKNTTSNKNKKLINDKIFYLIGEPYFIEGVEYTPVENYSYFEVGLATYYDKELHNIKTSNNDLNKVTELLGRHKTLPLPSIVKITNLENGLSLTIKIVDRLSDNSSMIQVSRKTAQLLRFYKNKITKVKLEILSDPSKQWKNVIMSINDEDFNNTVESAPTSLVLISNIDDNINEINQSQVIDQPIMLGLESVQKIAIFLHVNNFDNYDEIQLLMNELNLNLKYTSEKNDNNYKIIIGPIDNKMAKNLVSTFISKGYKDSELVFE